MLDMEVYNFLDAPRTLEEGQEALAKKVMQISIELERIESEIQELKKKLGGLNEKKKQS